MRRFKQALAGVGAVVLAVFAVVAQAQAQNAFSTTAPMATPRGVHRATLLTLGPNAGKVLVVGGQDGTTVLASAELYDPATGMWSSTGSLGTPRSNTFTATVLPNGKVLVAGGRTTGSVNTTTAELYDPLTGMWAPTGDLIGELRRAHIAVLLPNGKVLVAGGEVQPGDDTLDTAQLYDPMTGTWSSTGSLSVSRSGATAVLLPNGKVLVAGGVSGGCCGTAFFTNTAELYDPQTETWALTGNMATARGFSDYEHAVLLPNGEVLVAGGQTSGIGSSGIVPLATAELYDPVTGTWSFTGSMATPRQKFSTTLLPNGRVLVAGGDDQEAIIHASAEVYDPATGTWSSAGGLGTARALHSATLLPNGEVLVAGGAVDIEGHTTASAEVFAPCGPRVSNLVATPNPVPVNTTFTLSARVDDTTTDGSNITGADYTIDAGSPVPMNAQDGSFDEAIEDVGATVPGFAGPGVHNICVTGRDVAGNTGPGECILLAVFDPTAGFVTGGGWFDSPPGAYPADPALRGRAIFGFVSKYKKGAVIPTGVTEFQFKVAHLNFHSDTYEWLVVAGARAQYKGTGTINGMGNFGFLLTAIDGQITGGGGVDKFRIKIWDKTSGVIVYDNKLGADDTGNDATELGGGSIMIHKQ